jgi:hypothetical protein
VIATARFVQDAPIRTTRDLKTTSFFKRVCRGHCVEVLEHGIADNGNEVTKIRMDDGTEGWTSSWHLDVLADANQSER